MLFKSSFVFHINQEIIDERGNFIILDINIQDYRITLVAIYGPNEDNPDFFLELVFNINQFDNSSVIIAGDWNVVQDYRVDAVNYIGENNPKSKLEIHQIINSMNLVDVWRDKNPGVRRCTWRGPNKKQSRLDYFLVLSDIEYVVQSSDIGLSYRSDHSPVSIVLNILNQTRGRGTWKFNNSLLGMRNLLKK